MHRIVISGLAALASLAAVVPAQAGLTYASYTVLDNRNVTTVYDGNSEYSGSGQITLNNVNGGTGGLGVWCVDVPDELASAGGFDGTSFYTSNDPIYGKIEALMEHGTPLLGSSSDASAALQVAIWDELYGSSITVSADSASVNALAATYISDVTNGIWTADPTMMLDVLTRRGNQSQSFVAKVPEPASMVLLSVGMFGMSVIRRRRQAKGML
jgi:hypothetical protein